MNLKTLILLCSFMVLLTGCSGTPGSDATLDANDPIDATKGPENTTGNTDIPVSDYMAGTISFTDTSNIPGKIAGTITVKKAANESRVSHYGIYWGSSADTKLSGDALISRVEKTGADIACAISTPLSIPSGANYLLAFSDENGAEWSPTSAIITDLTGFTDTIAPAAGGSGNLSLISKSTTKMKIGWTKGVDETSARESLAYSVFYSTSPAISSHADALVNGTKAMDWTADIAGVEVTGLTAKTAYYANVFVKDEAGNIGAYSPLSATTHEGFAVTWASVQYPVSISTPKSSNIEVFGEYFADGVTTNPDRSQSVMVQLGWYRSTETIDQARYQEAVFVTKNGNNHQYKALTGFETAWTYYYFYRFSGTYGDTWVYSSDYTSVCTATVTEP